MPKITVQNMEKSYGGEALFSGLSFEAQPGMRLAVAGPNGSGKSTLLRILAGRTEPDGGSVVISKGARVGYVAQELSGADLAEPLLGWVLSALPSWRDFWREWEQAVEARDEVKLRRLSERQARLETQFGYHPEHKARAILSGLGFQDEDVSRRLEHLSGGWRERAKLARVLLQGADILLLDEPTNHLDLEAVQWLEDYLLAFKGTLIFVAHDRIFLERVGSHVLVLGGAKPVLRTGSFSDFLAWMAENAEQREREAAKLSARIDHEQEFIRRFRVKARKAAQAQSKIKKVEKLQDELSRLKGDQLAARPGRRLSFRLPEPPRGDKVAVNAVDLEFRYADRSQKRLWPRLNFQIFRGRKIALVAPNGAGKSTLLKVLTGELAATHGYAKLGNNTRMAYFSQHQTEILRPTGTVIGEMRRLCDPRCTEEQLMGVLGLFLLGESYFERPVAALSGGEKSRLVMASLFLGRANLLILDEPTNHLDLESREGLVAALKDFEGSLLMVAHDRYLMSEVAEEIWTLGPEGLIQHHEGFDDYDVKRRASLVEARQESRRGARKPECAPAASASSGEAEEDQGSRRLSKDEKRKLAEQRNALSRALKPLREEYAKCEKDLERVLLEQGELEAKMNDPATYESAGEALTVNNQYREVSDWAEKLMERMAGLEEKMAAVQAEMGACLDA